MTEHAPPQSTGVLALPGACPQQALVKGGKTANSIHLQQAPDNLTKAFATLRARAGLVGWTLAPEGCSFVAVRLGQERRFEDLAAVEVFLGQIGAPK